jgi:hypothetical protein
MEEINNQSNNYSRSAAFFGSSSFPFLSLVTEIAEDDNTAPKSQ